MVLHPASRLRAHDDGTTASLMTHECALCESPRLSGSLLLSRPGSGDTGVWVCIDCQNKLARRIDDEGALGG